MCGCKKNLSICNFVCNSWIYIVWILLFGCVTGYDLRGRPPQDTGYSEDEFKSNQPRFLYSEENYTVFNGYLAVLSCAIENLGTKTVVWRKLSDTNPLTVGKMTYVADPRFQTHHVIHKDQWNLHIRNVKDTDSGFYECQISTKERNLRKTFHLQVLEKPEETFLDHSGIMISGNFHVEIGDTLHLKCNATEAETPLEDISWFKDGNALENDKRARILKSLSIKDKSIKSELIIDRVEMSDTGYYLCRTSGDLTTHQHVQILNTAVNKDKRGTLIDSQTYEEQKYKGNSSSSIHGYFVILITVFIEILKNMF